MLAKLLLPMALLISLCAACAVKSPAPEKSPAVADTPIARTPASPEAIAATPSPAAVSLNPAALDGGWLVFSPGGETSCAHGGEYQFFVHPGDSGRILLYFEGGGSCFNGDTCKPKSGWFDPDVDLTQASDNPALKTEGIFALDDEQNPFRSDTIIFVAYCTGDGFLGHLPVEYSTSSQTFTVNHFGYQNTHAVLDWTFSNYPAPDRVAILGCSAGVVGSAYYAPYIMERYTGLPVTLIGDSGGGFFDGPPEIIRRLGALDHIANWLPAFSKVTAETLKATDLFAAPAAAYPQNAFGLIDTFEDSTQANILRQFDPAKSLEDLIAENLAAIRQSAPAYRSFNGPGDIHCPTTRPEFYRYKVNGVLLRDWVAALASGEAVENVKP